MVTFFEETKAGWRVRDSLRRMVRFETHNLLEAPPPPARFDLILCRNVLLYFDRSTRERAFDRLAQSLAPGRRLVLGGGVTTVGPARGLRPEKGRRGCPYRKRAAAASTPWPRPGARPPCARDPGAPAGEGKFELYANLSRRS
mgnify:CR=1 FL=1